jgi:hypothetical protein
VEGEGFQQVGYFWEHDPWLPLEWLGMCQIATGNK